MSGIEMEIVSGPTSVGKSTYIAAHRNLYDGVLPPHGDAPLPHGPGKYAFHYNVLRAWGEVATRPPWVRWRALRGHRVFADVEGVLRSKASVRAVVVVAPPAELRRRVRERTSLEPLQSRRAPYDSQRWLAILDRVDLAAVYRRWLAFLEGFGVPAQLVASEDGDFRPLAFEELWPLLAQSR